MRHRSLCLLVLLFVTAEAFAQEHLLNSKFVGRVLVVRNFYVDSALTYDSSGQVKHSAHTGDWTISQFKIQKAKLTAKGFELQGKRVALGYDTKKDAVTFFELQPLSMKIEDVPAYALTEAKLDELMHQLFVVLKDEPETVRDYWRDLVSGNVVAETGNFGRKTYRLKSVPPLKRPQSSDDVSVALTSPQGIPIYRVGGKVTPPKILKQIDPAFSELARQLHYQGTTKVLITIGEGGQVEDVRVTRPAGFGLDDNAVQAVKRWIFKPSTLDGKPVKSMVTVEVSYSFGL